MTTRPLWNHNIHYHDLVLQNVRSTTRSALDVGTGDGLLAAELRRRIPRVVGLDVDDDVLVDAASSNPSVEMIHADVMTHDFGEEQFDLVASIATIHHLPGQFAAFQRLADLTTPGGTLVVIDLARTTRVSEALLQLVGTAQHQVYSRTKGYWEHSAAIVPPSESFSSVRACAEDVLPGMRWRLLPLWRYSITWQKPA